ncbi:hypothetical protein HELRODRAFT_185662 [Helobdella robusta]|uniref:RING-type E3 ubiquitin transferase n=1 Tax=Helobdella robusta TaxID=6412 RepID=T1FN39_HELRO|nr:hypothetical protein HELRODRAFT_185662 [Helobdella robusta]ESO03033.1 hypothetical protein HELRODRAFT_185662 [Helobdella robusta]
MSSSAPLDVQKKILCNETKLNRYFMNGACAKNDSCTFSHDRADPLSTICTFYKNKSCSYGSSCRYDHVKVDDPKTISKTKTKVKFKALVSSNQELLLPSSSSTSVGSNWADAPEFVPGQQWLPPEPSLYSSIVQSGLIVGPDVFDEFVCAYCMETFDPNDDLHMQTCTSYHEEAMNESFRQQVSSSQVCGICLEVVWHKKPTSRQRFGVLSGCDHVFCLECIRKWRTQQGVHDDVRLCPQCRVRTDFVIPSHYWYENKEDKQDLINAYKTSLSKKPCRYFVRDGFCPFTKNCFYSHVGEDGRAGECLTRFKQAADGSSMLIKTNKLSDFFDDEEMNRTNN